MPEIIMYVDVDCIERANSGVVQILKKVYFEPEHMRRPLRNLTARGSGEGTYP
jgi:hypothetical protein